MSALDRVRPGGRGCHYRAEGPHRRSRLGRPTRELGERLAETQLALDHALHITFGADACRWFLLRASGAQQNSSAGRGTAATVRGSRSSRTPSTPRVRNEMLNRTELTSQGAKARRVLLTAMIEHGAEPDLGLDGYGPEVAMYRAFLKRAGLHGHDVRNDTMVFRKPSDRSLQPAWAVVEAEFKRAKTRRINLNDIYAALLLPPVGMKAAVVPVFVTAALLARSNEIAIYEHGTFRPLLTPELSERMVRNPGHFDIKHFANTTGARRKVVQALAERLRVQPRFRKHRVANVLSIVGHLVSQVRNLDNYTRRTRQSDRHDSSGAGRYSQPRSSRTGCSSKTFLTVLGTVGPFRQTPRLYPDAGVLMWMSVGAALDELGRMFRPPSHRTPSSSYSWKRATETTRLAIAGQAAALDNEVLNPEVRSLRGHSWRATELIRRCNDWIEAVATVVTKKAPAEWTDDDLATVPAGTSTAESRPSDASSPSMPNAEIDGGGPFNALRVTTHSLKMETSIRRLWWASIIGNAIASSKVLDDVLKELEGRRRLAATSP